MGWQDAPLVEESTTTTGQAFTSAPEVAPVQPTAPEPTMGQVALNAVPKGLANLLNTPITLANLIMSGIASLPGAGHLTGLQAAAAEPELKQNPIMDLAAQAGIVDPAKNPQTGPQRIVDTAIQAAISAAAVPAAGVVGAVKGAAIGAASGAAAQTTKELTGSDLLAVAVGVATPFAVRAALETGSKVLLTDTGKLTLKEAQQVGYVVEPSAIRQPSSKLETIAGKASIAQEAATRNQTVTNRLAAKSIGLPEDTPLSPSLLNELKKRAAKPYEEVEVLRASQTNLPWFPRYHSPSLMDELTQARQDATALYKAYYARPDEGVRKAAEAASSLAKSIEADIDMIANAAGQPDLLDRLKAARMLYARINDVEKALNVGSGNVSAPILGRMVDKGAPLSGELRTVGKFAQAFPRVAREVESVPPSGVSGTDAAGAAVLSIGGAAAAGSPAGAVAGGLPLLRGPARNRMLSPTVQKGLLTELQPTPIGETAGRAAMIGKTVEENQP